VPSADPVSVYGRGVTTLKPADPVLVTGGSSGLGRVVVDHLLDAGRPVAVLDLKPPAADVPYVPIDLAEPREAEAAVHRLAAQAGGLGAVVTASGVDSPGRLAEVAPDDWERVLRINLLTTVAVVRAALPYLEASHGHVVTVASTLGLRTLGDATAYCAARFGLVGFTRALAAELGEKVGVTLLIPGGIRTATFEGGEERVEPAADARLNDPATVAAAVGFALDQPPSSAVRELVICPNIEPTYP